MYNLFVLSLWYVSFCLQFSVKIHHQATTQCWSAALCNKLSCLFLICCDNNTYTFNILYINWSLPSHSLRSNNDNSLSVPRVKTNTGARAFHSCAPVSLEQPAAVCPFSHFSCYLYEISEDTSLWLGLSPIDTVTPHGLLMLRNCFLDFAVEHWFGCRATEPGFARDIGAIEVWLIDWLIKNVAEQTSLVELNKFNSTLRNRVLQHCLHIHWYYFCIISYWE